MKIKERMMENMMNKMKPNERQQMMSMMMEQFFSTMSPEDKQNMMDGMMEKFLGNLTDEEKRSMMSSMMPKMMSSMMGGGKNTMMDMLKNMISGRKEGEGTAEMPWDMCKKMMGNIGKYSELASYATPELHQLFEEWLSQINEEVVETVQKEGKADPEALSGKFKLSNESIHFILGKLAQEGKINIKAERK
jgi:hypothetical protein